MHPIEKVSIIVKETPLEGLVKRYGTKSQARFVLEQRQVSFTQYDKFDRTYHSVLDLVREGLPPGVRVSVVDFQYLPTYQFDPHAAIVTIGPDGLVANTAKYLDGQPLIAINPDPSTIDGVLARNSPSMALELLRSPQIANEQQLAMAQATLADGQTLLAVNDLFIGQRTHISARYEIEHRGRSERQSSSGIIVSTGAGSTGWRRSVLTGAARVVENEVEGAFVGELESEFAFPPDARKLAFAVREPFISRASSADIAVGEIEGGEEMVVTSQMTQTGVIFSDGVESDFLEFNGGSVARIGLAAKTVRLWSI